MFVHETPIRVRYAETDQMGCVYHSNFFQYFEVGRAEAIRSLGFDYATLEKEGTYMPVTEVHAKYLRPALYDSLLTIKTILKEIPTTHRVEFFFEVLNEEQKLLCTGRVVLFFMDSKTQSKSKAPAVLEAALKPFFA
jgi:acyl-CoA thioester hydrolase